MNAPSSELREEIAKELDELTAAVAARDAEEYGEDQLDEILGIIENAVDKALQSDAQDEDEHAELAAVDAWAGLASYAVARFYAPKSPWPWHEAGWTKRAPERLRRIASKLRPALERAARALGAASWSVSVGFPWGISIAVSWP